jgi:hypothetical protein
MFRFFDFFAGPMFSQLHSVVVRPGGPTHGPSFSVPSGCRSGVSGTPKDTPAGTRVLPRRIRGPTEMCDAAYSPNVFGDPRDAHGPLFFVPSGCTSGESGTLKDTPAGMASISHTHLGPPEGMLVTGRYSGGVGLLGSRFRSETRKIVGPSSAPRSLQLCGSRFA